MIAPLLDSVHNILWEKNMNNIFNTPDVAAVFSNDWF